MAYAMYRYDLEGATGPAEIHLNWQGGAAKTWIGLPNWTANRWEWSESIDGVAAVPDLDSVLSDNGELIAAVVLAGHNILPATLNSVAVEGVDIPQPGSPPQIDGVGPLLSGPAGTKLTLTAQISGGAAQTYAWDFGGGATPGTSSLATPYVKLGQAGQYSCSLDVTNADGTSHCDFTLWVHGAAEWVHTIGGNEDDVFTVVGLDAQGNILAAGNAGVGIALAKYTTAGELIWRKTYHCSTWYPPAYEYIAYTPLSMVQDADGNIYLLTSSWSKDGPDQTGFMLKFTADGGTVWGNHLGVDSELPHGMVMNGTGNGLKVLRGNSLMNLSLDGEVVDEHALTGASGPFDATCICATPDGGTYLVGWGYAGDSMGMAVARLDDADESVWYRNWTDPSVDYQQQIPTSCQLAPDGRLLIGSYVWGPTGNQMVLTAIGADGDLDFSTKWDSLADCPTAIAVDATGNILVVCGANWGGPTLHRLSSAGTLLNSNKLAGTEDSNGFALLPMTDGSFVTAGYAPSACVHLEAIPVQPQTMTMEMSESDIVEESPPSYYNGDDMHVTTLHYLEDIGGGGHDGLLMRLNAML